MTFWFEDVFAQSWEQWEVNMILFQLKRRLFFKGGGGGDSKNLQKKEIPTKQSSKKELNGKTLSINCITVALLL
jgi:hypothetical protein